MQKVILIAFLLVFGNTFAQKTPSDTVYKEPDADAAFPGGRSAMNKFILENLKFPETAGESIYEKIYIQFLVEKDGSIQNVEMLRAISDCPECNAELIRLVKSMPNWIPAKVKGEPVRSFYFLPVNFHPGS